MKVYKKNVDDREFQQNNREKEINHIFKKLTDRDDIKKNIIMNNRI